MESGQVWLLVYGAGVVVAFIVGANKGRAGTGLLFGLLLSWLGVAIIAMSSPSAEAEGRRPCPHCAELVLPAAKVCPHCQRDLHDLGSASK